MWCFQEMFSSKYTPRNLMANSLLIETLSMCNGGKIFSISFLFLVEWSKKKNILHWEDLSKACWLYPYSDGPFRSCLRTGGGEQKAPAPSLKSATYIHTYSTLMKLGTVIPYLRKIQEIYKSRDTPLEFCWHQHFFTRNQQILVYQET